MWQYIFIEEANHNKFIQLLNQYGEQNWEVCGYTTFSGAGSTGRGRHFVIMKRQSQ